MISVKAQNIAPYVAGEQPESGAYIKLNTNENPYPPSPKIKEFLALADFCKLRLYPDPQSVRLREAIARKEDVTVHNVFVGNGSDEVLALAFLTLFERTRGRVLFGDVTYSFYRVWAELFDLAYTAVPLSAEYKIIGEDYCGSKDISGIVIANPNAPTSRLLALKDIEMIVSVNKNTPVIVDEAYIDFAGANTSAVGLTARYNNLVVVKTFSKSYSLAGIRVGYAIASEPLISALTRIKDCYNSYPVGMISGAAATIAIGDAEYHKLTVERIIRTRESASKELVRAGFEVVPSAANFLWVRHFELTGMQIYGYLKNNNIIVRAWDKPRLDGHVRITVGNDGDMDKLCKALKKL